MSSIEERVVSIKFNNSQFESAIRTTITSLDGLRKSLDFDASIRNLSALNSAGKNVDFKFNSKGFDESMKSAMNSANDLSKGVKLDGVVKSLHDLEGAGKKVHLKLDPSGVQNGARAIIESANAIKTSLTFENVQKSFGALKTSAQNINFASIQAGAQTAVASLGKISEAAARVDLNSLSGNVDKLSTKFSGLGAVGTGALMAIGAKAAVVLPQMAAQLIFDPAKSGLQEYETNLNSIQTILANTQSKGSTITDVNAALDELNTYSDKTIYNFGEMAKSIGTFTTAGVDLKTSTTSIKGLSNVAAMSGANSTQAASAMEQLSRALSSGSVKLQDWMSIETAGMASESFRESLMETAKQHDIDVDGMIKKEGSFRETLKSGWLSTEIMTETLSKFTGDLTDAQLAQMGYNDQQIRSIQEMAKTAGDSATKVKTFTQLMGTLQEATGTGWATSMRLILGDFEQARTMWTAANKVLGGMIGESADARNKMLGDWNALGGRDVMIESVSNAFKVLMGVLNPIKDAFREVFPPTTGQQLYDITVAIRNITAALIPGAETTNLIKNSFKLLFTIIKIGVDIIKGALGVIFAFFKAFATGGDSIAGSMKPLTDFLAKVTNDLANSTFVTDFFANLTKVATALGTAMGRIVPFLIQFGTALYNIGYTVSGVAMYEVSRFVRVLVAGFVPALSSAVDIFYDIVSAIKIFVWSLEDGVGVAFRRVIERVESFKRLGGLISSAWDQASAAIQRFWEKIKPLRDAISKMFTDIGNEIRNALTDVNFSDTIDLVNMGLLGGLVLLFKNFFKRLTGMGDGVRDSFMEQMTTTFESVDKVLESLTGTLGAMQQNLQAGTLMKIALAVGVLTLSVIALSMIDSAKLTKGLIAIGVMVVILGKAMGMLDQISVGSGFLKIPFIAAGMILLSIAVLILTAAVKNLSELSWGELVKGLAGTAVLLLAVAKAAEIMSRNPANLIATGIGIIAVAIAIKILASALADMAKLSFGEMIQGLIGVGAILVALSIFNNMTKVNQGSMATMAGLILLAVALKVLASALADFASMSVGELIQGLLALGTVLLVLSQFTNSVSGAENMIKTAVALVILGAALHIIVAAMKTMAAMSWEELAKGLITTAVALRAITTAMALLPKNMLANAVGMIAIGAALKIIASALKDMGGLSWEEITKGLLVLSVTMGVLAVSLRLMQGSISGALAIFIVAAALAILTPVLQTLSQLTWEEMLHGFAALAGIFIIFGLAGLMLIPIVPVLHALGVSMLMMGLGLLSTGMGTVLFAAGLVAIGTAVMAVGPQLVIFVGTILALIPLAMMKLGEGLREFANVMAASGPEFLRAMVVLISTLLQAIDIVAPQILQTLWNLLVGLVALIVRAVPLLVDAGMKIIVGILTGIGNNMHQLLDAATKVIVEFLDGISRNLPQITESGMNLIITFIESMATSIRNNSDRMATAGADLVGAIIDGMVNGIAQMGGRVLGAIGRLAEDVLAKAADVLNINSPSKEFIKIGKSIDEGWADGIDADGHLVTGAAGKVGQATIDTLKKTMASIGSVVSTDMDMAPVIRPVLDLSAIKKDSGLVGGMIGAGSLSVGASYGVAASLSASERAKREAAMAALSVDSTNMQGAPAITYVQNNNSPKSLSRAEIYRRTKNQLSMVKGGLVNSA